jgi:hypothetical protein
MTAPTITEDFMFDLDLRLVPVEERKDLLPRAETTAYDGCIGVPYSLGSCNSCHCNTRGGATCYTCRRCV